MFLIIIVAFFYFIPTMVGWNKRNVGAIFALNLFLGWTFIGWVVSLVWACTNDSESQVSTKDSYKKELVKDKADRYDKLLKLKSLLDSGAITEIEYQSEKQKILSGLTTEWKI